MQRNQYDTHSTMNHRPVSDHLKDSHLSEEYLYVHQICLSKYQIIQNFHKNVLMNKYQKRVERSSMDKQLQNNHLIHHLERFFFFLLALDQKEIKLTKTIASKNAWLWSDFTHPPALIFLSLLLSPSAFSPTKSVIIAQDTRNIYYVIINLTKHDNYRKLSSMFFFVLFFIIL